MGSESTARTGNVAGVHLIVCDWQYVNSTLIIPRHILKPLVISYANEVRGENGRFVLGVKCITVTWFDDFRLESEKPAFTGFPHVSGDPRSMLVDVEELEAI